MLCTCTAARSQQLPPAPAAVPVGRPPHQCVLQHLQDLSGFNAHTNELYQAIRVTQVHAESLSWWLHSPPSPRLPAHTAAAAAPLWPWLLASAATHADRRTPGRAQTGAAVGANPIDDEALWEGRDYPETQQAHVEAKKNAELLQRINKRAGEGCPSAAPPPPSPALHAPHAQRFALGHGGFQTHSLPRAPPPAAPGHCPPSPPATVVPWGGAPPPAYASGGTQPARLPFQCGSCAAFISRGPGAGRVPAGVEPAVMLDGGVTVSEVAAEAVQNVRSLFTSLMPGKKVRAVGGAPVAPPPGGGGGGGCLFRPAPSASWQIWRGGGSLCKPAPSASMEA